MKKSLLIGWTTAFLVGLVFGLQQTTSIWLSSFHDLPSFPPTSLIAILFIVWLHVFFFGFLGLVFGGLLGFLGKKKKEKKAQELFLIPLGLGFGIFLSVFVFLFGRFQSVFFKKTVILIVLGVSGLGGAFFGFLFYPAVAWLAKRKKRWLKIKKIFLVFSFFIFLGSTLGVGGVALAHHFQGLPGLPKKPRLTKQASAERPNVILLTIDALRADHLGFAGYPKGVSPRLDEIASRGVIFENTLANAPWTLPSLASMASSRYPTELKISVDNLSFGQIEKGNYLTSQVETMAERFQTLGYNTQAILTNELLSSQRGFEQGFDGFVNLEKLMPYHYHFHFKNMALTLLVGRISKMEKGLERFYTFMVGPSGPKQFETPAWEINRWALPWLKNFADSRFFLWLHYIDPHAPYDPGPNYSPDLSEIGAEREAELRQASADQPDKIRWREIDKASLEALYDGDISLVDAAVGEIWEKLEELGLKDKTILLISADHGEEFWEHGGLGHGRTLYQEVIHVPLVVVGPGIEPRRVSQKVSLIDFFPTLVDLVGEKKPLFAQGQSFKPLLMGLPLAEKTIFSEGTGRGTERRAIVKNQYKLIHDFFSLENSLYNLDLENYDQQNIAGSWPGVVDSLEGQLLDWVKKARANREEIFVQKEAAPSFGDVVGY